VPIVVGFVLIVVRNILNAGFEAPTAVIMKGSIFCDITTCSPLKVYRRFGGLNPLHDGFLLGLFFDPADRGNMFLRNELHDVILQKVERLVMNESLLYTVRVFRLAVLARMPSGFGRIH
jgi:hypothetical protein